uniref:Uncharacterized protein n=1 Tax=Cacopsylla melanoneura TaxID=428564 RepID=A0A8D9BFE9_9HEMI
MRGPPPVSDDESLSENPLSSDEWVAPPLFPEDNTVESNNSPFEFTPFTQEREPDILKPSPDMEAAYLKAPKELQAGGAYACLQVNPEINLRPSPKSELLASLEGTFGVIVHGLLLQRKAFENAVDEVIKKHPLAASDIHQALTSSSSFRKSSDNLLQYACETRKDVILSRRKQHGSTTRVHPNYLKEIPPGGGEPKLLSEAMRHHASKNRPQLPYDRPTSKKFSRSVKQKSSSAKRGVMSGRVFKNTSNVSKSTARPRV